MQYFLSCDIPAVLDTIRWYRIVETKHNYKVVEYLLLRRHVSALALGHHQVSNCASEETIQCSRIAYIIQRDQEKLASPDNCQWSRYQRDLFG